MRTAASRVRITRSIVAGRSAASWAKVGKKSRATSASNVASAGCGLRLAGVRYSLARTRKCCTAVANCGASSQASAEQLGRGGGE